MQNKASQNGFTIQWMREDGNVQAYVKQDKNSESTCHCGVNFRGDLTVQNEELFQKAFENGIGSGKLYGFGMLMLFPIGGNG